jgi:hypothetical protein
MKERPILFSGPMVRALLAGTKTQTRRVFKSPRRKDGLQLLPDVLAKIGVGAASPYGQPGDRLWVRETWAVPHRYDHLGPSNIPVKGVPTHYAATEDRGGLMWRPSIHMCRWASRLTLEVTGVCVERLQDISEADAIAEGLRRTDVGAWLPGPCDHPEWAYHQLWDQINGAGSWDANPWVWVVEFKRAEGGAA